MRAFILLPLLLLAACGHDATSPSNDNYTQSIKAVNETGAPMYVLVPYSLSAVLQPGDFLCSFIDIAPASVEVKAVAPGQADTVRTTLTKGTSQWVVHVRSGSVSVEAKGSGC